MSMSIHEYVEEKYINLVINVTRYSEEETEARMGTSINIFHSIVSFQTKTINLFSPIFTEAQFVSVLDRFQQKDPSWSSLSFTHSLHLFFLLDHVLPANHSVSQGKNG